MGDERGPWAGSSSGASSDHVWCWAITSVSGPIVNRPASLVEHAGRPLGRGEQGQPVLGQRRRGPQLTAGADGVAGTRSRRREQSGPVACARAVVDEAHEPVEVGAVDQFVESVVGALVVVTIGRGQTSGHG